MNQQLHTQLSIKRKTKLPSLTRISRNRGRWIQWRCHNCSRQLRNSCFCACAVKIRLKIIWNVVKLPKFPCVYKKSMSLRTTVVTGFGTEADIMPILRMRKEKWPKTAVSAFRLRKFLSLIGNRGRWIQRRCHNNCSRKLGTWRFCACAVKMCPKSTKNVAKSPTFQNFYRKSTSLRTTVSDDRIRTGSTTNGDCAGALKRRGIEMSGNGMCE